MKNIPYNVPHILSNLLSLYKIGNIWRISDINLSYPIIHEIILCVHKDWYFILFNVLQVRTAAPMVDTKAPPTYMHLHLKLKKLQVSYN